jgi:hypothetical protein
MSPPWPLLPPADPDLTCIVPEFPIVEPPVDMLSSPDAPPAPELAVTTDRDPELASLLVPLEIMISPPTPLVLEPADTAMLPPFSSPFPEMIATLPPSP